MDLIITDAIGKDSENRYDFSSITIFYLEFFNNPKRKCLTFWISKIFLVLSKIKNEI